MATRTTLKATVEIEIVFKGDKSAEPDMDLIRKYVGWGADVKILQCNKNVVTTGPQINHVVRCSNQYRKHTTIDYSYPIYGTQLIRPERIQFHCYMGRWSRRAHVFYYGPQLGNNGRVPTICIAKFEFDEASLQTTVTLEPEGLQLLKDKWGKQPPAILTTTLCAYNHKDFPAQMAKVTDDIKGLWKI